MIQAWVKEKPVLILAVCRTPVTYELSFQKWPCSLWLLVAQWIQRPSGVRSWVQFLSGTQIFLCNMLMSCRLIHLSQVNCSFPHALHASVKRSQWPPSNSLPGCSRNFKKMYWLENLHAKVLIYLNNYLFSNTFIGYHGMEHEHHAMSGQHCENRKQFTVTCKTLTIIARDRRWPDVVAGISESFKCQNLLFFCFAI